MKIFKSFIKVLSVLTLFPPLIFALNASTFAVGNQGYDVVSYFVNNAPIKGNVDFVVVNNGVSYLFVNNDNQKAFMANPQKYLPQYGGWSVMGVATGKKISSDPFAWKILNGKLYLNQNNTMAKIWLKDVSGNLKEADSFWLQIQDTDPNKL